MSDANSSEREAFEAWFFKESRLHLTLEQAWEIWQAARQTPAPQVHPDDLAVDRFAAAMKEKLAIARSKGRGGWKRPIWDGGCSQADLSSMLRDHVEKGDPRDVANFCMFLHQRGESIAPPQTPAPPGEMAKFAHAYGLFAQGKYGEWHLQFIDGDRAIAHKLHGEVMKHPTVQTVNGAGFKVLPIMVSPKLTFRMSKDRLREVILSDAHDIGGDESAPTPQGGRNNLSPDSLNNFVNQTGARHEGGERLRDDPLLYDRLRHLEPTPK